MQNFAAQCLDMAHSILSHNLTAIREDGSIENIKGEVSRLDEPGHAALAIGEFYRASGETTLDGMDIIDLAARTITAQAFTEEEAENGLAFASLGLLSFGPSKDRNLVWERLVDVTRETLDRRLLARTDYDNHLQAFNIAKSVARYSMGLSKKDETSRLIDRFLERTNERSSGSFCDDSTSGLGGTFDIYGVLSFVTIRQSLQLYANIGVTERKLPSLRTYAEKYLKLIPDLVRQDGLGWAYGRGIGAYGQMHLISMILQAMRDQWIPKEKLPLYHDALRKLFQFFFVTYLDQEQGFLVIRDGERGTHDYHTSRMANFDAARYLSQWSRLAQSIVQPENLSPVASKTTGKFVSFDKTQRKEQGLFIYQDASSGFSTQLPLLSGSGSGFAGSLAFPHCPGVYDWPVDKYFPIMVPELTFKGVKTVPSFYGKKCTTGLGPRRSFYFRYEQPELISNTEEMQNGIGSCKVSWTFSGSQITSEFIYTVKNEIQLDSFRYGLVIAAPHSSYKLGTSFTLGAESLRPVVTVDDFQGQWSQPEVVSSDPSYKTYWGKIHYLQVLERNHPLIMRPGQPYKLSISYDPDLAFAGE